MSGLTEGDNRTVDFSEQVVPIPVTHADFSLDWRKLTNMENMPGDMIDTSHISQATRRVSEKLEELLFRGDSSININGNSLEGLMNFSDAVDVTSGTPSLSGDWGGTPGNIYDDVRNWIERAYDVNYTGPYTLFLNYTQLHEIRQVDAEGTGDIGTAEDRLEALPELDRIVPVQELDDSEGVLVDMSEEVLDLSIAADIQAVEWESHGGMKANYKVMAVLAPRLKSDYEGNTGILYADNL